LGRGVTARLPTVGVHLRDQGDGRRITERKKDAGDPWRKI